MKFKHLNVPESWQHYWSRYPEGYTILEALISWVSQVDTMVDNQNKLTDNVEQFRNEIDAFIGRFDERLQGEVTQTLQEWQASGFIDVVISEALQWQLDDYITTNEQDKLSLNTQLAQTIGLNVTQFGFVADGATDNIQPFIDLINYANEQGGNIDFLFPKGFFKIGSAINVPQITVPNVRFKGAHKDLTKLYLTSGVYFNLNGGTTILRGFSIRDMSIEYSVPDLVNPTVRSLGFAAHEIENVSFRGGCTFIEMGSPDTMSYALRMRYVTAVIANKGKPFIKLVNGAGFIWDTFDSVYHIESIHPTFDRTSVMNTVPGTNAVDIVGSWDTVEMSVFAEKMYRVINIDGVAGTIVFNLRLKDSVCDYIRDAVVYADMKASSTSLNTVSIDNVYGTTWEGHGFYFKSNSADIRNITFDNVYTPFTGKSALFFEGVSSGVRKWLINGCRFLGASRIDDTYDTVDIGLVTNLVMTGNRIGGSDSEGNIPWGADKGLRIRNAAAMGECLITGNVLESYNLSLPGAAIKENASKLRRIINNVFRGTSEALNYAGLKRTDFAVAPYVKPASETDWYNVSPYDVEVYIGGSAVTDIKVDGVSLPYLQGSFMLEPGHYYSITYSDALNAKVTYNVKQ